MCHTGNYRRHVPWHIRDIERPVCVGRRVRMSLAIGVISYNRLPLVQRCVERIRRHTQQPYRFVVADDGSTDGTVDWCKSQKIPVVHGENRGCAWNKNRALYYFHKHHKFESLVLFEDDSYPDRDGWDIEWSDGIQRWHHLNISTDPSPGETRNGKGTGSSPWWLKAFWGNVHGVSREALWAVGYLDTRFGRYGWEHVEWSWRFANHFGSKKVPGWVPNHLPILSASSGVRPTWDAKSHHPGDAEVAKNYAVYQKIVNDPVPRPPARTPGDFARLHEEIGLPMRPATVTGVKPNQPISLGCIHRGPATGQFDTCKGCAGKSIEVPTFRCKVHGECSADPNRDTNTVRSCRSCNERVSP